MATTLFLEAERRRITLRLYRVSRRPILNQKALSRASL